MSQWEYVVKEVPLWGVEEYSPEKFSVKSSTLPEEKKRLKGSFNEGMIVELTDFGEALQFELDELGEAGWEVYHIERRDKKRSWLQKVFKGVMEVDYRLFAKRRRSE